MVHKRYWCKVAKKRKIIKSILKSTPSSPTAERPRMHYDEIEYIRALLAVIPNLSEVQRIRNFSQDEISKYHHLKNWIGGL